MHRARNPTPLSNVKKTEESAAAEMKKSTNANSYNNMNNGNTYTNKKNGGYRGLPAVRAPHQTQDITNASKETKVWHGFAVSAPNKYANDADAAAAAAAAPKIPQPEPRISEKFKVRGQPKVDFEQKEEATPTPERKAMLPPHLRKKVKAAAEE
jgi:hypothetical protein